MRLQPGSAPTKSEVAYRALADAIDRGELEPGERLTLTVLAEQLDMSLTPVRDALVMLAEHGYVERRPNHATVVSSRLRHRAGEVALLRSALEPHAARMAALQGDPVGVRAIVETCEAFEAAVARPGGESADPAGLNALFHRRVAAASGSPVLADFIDRLWKLLPVQPLTATGQLARAAAEHRRITDAIVAGDSQAAWSLMAGHVGEVDVATQRFLDSDDAPAEDSAADA